MKGNFNKKIFTVVRGGGDLATGCIHRLWRAGIPVLVLETQKPAAIRRQVSVCEAVYEGSAVVEEMRAVLVNSVEEARSVLAKGDVPVMIDPDAARLDEIKPSVLVDAIIAKRNLGTNRSMAPLTIALGPGFCAGKDVDFVVETKRGHNLGRIIECGEATPDTGVPGVIGGYAKERVIHAEHEGILINLSKIGDIVKKDQVIAQIQTEEEVFPVKATIEGILRGLIRDEYAVTKGFKIADIDPRKEELKNCFTISDKARCIAGSVLELICRAAARE